MKELEDLSVFPARFRNAQTAYIGYVVKTFGIYRAFIAWLKTAGFRFSDMYDLCSGSGEPALHIYRQSAVFGSLTLSDKFPVGLRPEQSGITYLKEPAEVQSMHFEARKCYTMFNALHHFSDDEKTTLCEKISKAGSEAVFAEILQPGVLCMLKVLLATTAGVFLLTPFIRPVSLSTLFFTYVLPLNILFISYDGVVSVLKSRSEKQYRALFAGQEERIEIIRSGSLLAPLICIRIHPL